MEKDQNEKKLSDINRKQNIMDRMLKKLSERKPLFNTPNKLNTDAKSFNKGMNKERF
jgi:hypothetical protein